jgi:hypothetical protein
MHSATDPVLARVCWMTSPKSICCQTCREKGQWKQPWSRSSSESLQTTHVRGHWTPLSCSLRLVGTTFLQIRQIRFLILGGIFNRRRWEESVRTSTHNLYALQTKLNPFFSTFQISLSSVTWSTNEVFKINLETWTLKTCWTTPRFQVLVAVFDKNLDCRTSHEVGNIVIPLDTTPSESHDSRRIGIVTPAYAPTGPTPHNKASL